MFTCTLCLYIKLRIISKEKHAHRKYQSRTSTILNVFILSSEITPPTPKLAIVKFDNIGVVFIQARVNSLISGFSDG